jgi:hypothetical protein
MDVVRFGHRGVRDGSGHRRWIQRYRCRSCGHPFTDRRSARRISEEVIAQIAWEWCCKRSVRNVKTSTRFGRISKDAVLGLVVQTGRALPLPETVSRMVGIQWSGRFALDGLFGHCAGAPFVVLICSDLVSLDVVAYGVYRSECYASWVDFLRRLRAILADQLDPQFFVSDGKRGLHQALSETFHRTPRQLCTAHKLRRIFQIVPHIRGDAYDQLIAHIAARAILAPDIREFRVYANLLGEFRKDPFHGRLSAAHQRKLAKVIGALRFQQHQLHTRYRQPDLIGDDHTTNSHEGSINGFLKERFQLMRGFKQPEHVEPIVRLLITYYRFHRFTASRYSERNGLRPIELNVIGDEQMLERITRGHHPWSWIRNLRST